MPTSQEKDEGRLTGVVGRPSVGAPSARVSIKSKGFRPI